MRIIPNETLPLLHETPLASIKVDRAGLVLTCDDQNERTVQFLFRPLQAVRITTSDCFILPVGHSIIPKTIMEVEDSEWLQALRANLRVTDTTATFMNTSRHFLVPLQDSFLEVAAWDVTVETIRKDL